MHPNDYIEDVRPPTHLELKVPGNPYRNISKVGINSNQCLALLGLVFKLLGASCSVYIKY